MIKNVFIIFFLLSKEVEKIHEKKKHVAVKEAVASRQPSSATQILNNCAYLSFEIDKWILYFLRIYFCSERKEQRALVTKLGIGAC